MGFLYCISYIKYYCFPFTRIIYEEKFQKIQKNEIYKFLNASSNFRNLIKIYILKLLNLIILKNYHFINLIEEKQLFFNDFDFKEKVPCSLNYLFIQNENFAFYKILRKEYSLCKIVKFRTTKKILELIDNDYKNCLSFIIY